MTNNENHQEGPVNALIVLPLPMNAEAKQEDGKRKMRKE